MPDLAHPAAAFALGVALGAAPGPVQVLLLAEATRGGVRRGLRVMVGVTGVFLIVLALLAFGLSSAHPGVGFLRAVRIAGGAFLLYVAADALRTARRPAEQVGHPESRLDPMARGVLAVVLSPGAWIFFATSAQAIIADATLASGTALALATGAAMASGAVVSDFGAVLLGSVGRRFLTETNRRRVDYALAVALAGLGVWFFAQGLV